MRDVMGSFLDVVMPPLLLLALCVALVYIAAHLAVKRLHLWAVQRRRIDNPRKALATARDALASVISDPALFGTTRDQVLAAYTAVQDALKKEKDS